jgi:hypothetical protein
VRLVALVLLLPGCDRVFKLEDIDPPEIDAPAGDGSRTADAPPIDAPDAPSACPLGYTLIGTKNSFYKLVNTATSFPNARGICNMDEVGITRHTHLVVLDDETERVLVNSYWGPNLWIGLVRIGPLNAFQPITDQMTSFPPMQVPPWAGGQPSGQTGENCVRTVPPSGVTVAGALDDSQCGASLKYVCECDDSQDNPNH